MIAVRDPVNNAPLAYADPPEICGALELGYARRARVDDKHLDLLENPPRNLWIKIL